MKEIYQQTAEDVLERVESQESGLTGEQVGRAREKCGWNELAEGKKKSILQIFFEQYKDFLVLILIASAVISGMLGDVESAAVIVIVITINAILGTVQTVKAEQSLQSLKKLSGPEAKVLRDGVAVQLPARELVVGDVILLEAGDMIPADGRLIENASLKVDESALTGESLAVEKSMDTILEDAPLGDRTNMLFSGSFVTYGRGRAVVTNVGMQTEVGKIAGLLKSTSEKQTPLQANLDDFGKKLSILILIFCGILFAISVFRGEKISSAFMFAVALAVAAIPEALSSIVTIVLSFGTQKMAKEHAIIRKLQAVEGLGSVSVICSDKTGTLTQNKMTVVDHYGDEKLLARAMSLCSDAQEDSDGLVIGEPTEAALVSYAISLGMHKGDLKADSPRIGEAPFDSGRKMMSTVHKTPDGIIQYTKGAPDVVVDLCTHAFIDGKIVPMTDEIKATIASENKRMADKALRVLAAAMRKYDSAPDDFSPEALEHDLIFIGLTGMIDPVRPEVKAAIEECRGAGITPVMITGDHKDTAVAIASELGILTDPSQAITGAELSAMSDEEFADRVENIYVYARVQPEHKTRIVNAWRSKGKITAMTGDGVNDAPSIKSADIGIGMGITGTDVTKNVADMVLTDDNFATIVNAVEEGRRIYDNIRKAIQFLLGSNLAEVLAIFTATLLGFTILEAPHLLFINLVTDCFPALALGLEKAESDIMRRRPRDPSDGIFAGGLGFDVLYQGLLVTALTLAAFFIGERFETGHWAFMNIAQCEQGMTMAFLTMSMCEIFHSFNMRSQRGSVIKMSLRGSHNMPLFGAMVASLVLTTAVIEIPFLANAFGFTPIGFAEYATSLALAFSIIPIVEIIKVVQRAAAKRKASR